jgi:hypothetical protein
MYGMDVGAFRAWLQSFQPQEIVGWASEETACPVARWMDHVHHRAFRIAGSSVFMDDAPFSSFPAPAWVPRFVAELDDLYDHHPVSVSAASAFSVLDEVLLEVGYGSSL